MRGRTRPCHAGRRPPARWRGDHREADATRREEIGRQSHDEGRVLAWRRPEESTHRRCNHYSAGRATATAYKRSPEWVRSHQSLLHVTPRKRCLVKRFCNCEPMPVDDFIGTRFIGHVRTCSGHPRTYAPCAAQGSARHLRSTFGQTMAAVTQPTNTSCRPASSTHRRNNRVYGVSCVQREKRSRMTAFALFASFADRCTSVSDNPSQIKSTFHMSRSACWPLCAWTIRATIRGARPYGLRCLHWDPRRNAHGVCQMLYRHGWSVTL